MPNDINLPTPATVESWYSDLRRRSAERLGLLTEHSSSWGPVWIDEFPDDWGGEEYPDDNPKTAHGIAKTPMHLVPPILIAQVAEAFADGAKKYGPYNWREKNISSSVYYAAAMRHFTAWWDGEDYATDSGVHHLAAVAACCAMILDTKDTGKLNDDRPTPGPMPEFLRQQNNVPE